METHCSHFCCKCQCNVQHLFTAFMSNYAEAQPQTGVKNYLGVRNSSSQKRQFLRLKGCDVAQIHQSTRLKNSRNELAESKLIAKIVPFFFFFPSHSTADLQGEQLLDVQIIHLIKFHIGRCLPPETVQTIGFLKEVCLRLWASEAECSLHQQAFASFPKTDDRTPSFLTYNHLKFRNQPLTTNISLKGPEEL